MKMLPVSDFQDATLAESGAAFNPGSFDLEAKTVAMAARLGDALLTDASALMTRLTNQLLRQEMMLREERARSVALELQLASLAARSAVRV